jgi:hypothetical protein
MVKAFGRKHLQMATVQRQNAAASSSGYLQATKMPGDAARWLRNT